MMAPSTQLQNTSVKPSVCLIAAAAYCLAAEAARTSHGLSATSLPLGRAARLCECARAHPADFCLKTKAKKLHPN